MVVTSALRYWAPIDIPSAFADPCPDSEAGVRSQAVTSTEPHRLREPRACPVVKRHNAKSHHCWSQREVTIARTLRRAPVTEVCHSQVRNFAETPDRPCWPPVWFGTFPLCRLDVWSTGEHQSVRRRLWQLSRLGQRRGVTQPVAYLRRCSSRLAGGLRRRGPRCVSGLHRTELD